MFDEIAEYFDDILSKYQYNFRKDFTSQHCLLVLIGKWKKIRDKENSLGSLLTDLWKAFNSFMMEAVII